MYIDIMTTSGIGFTITNEEGIKEPVMVGQVQCPYWLLSIQASWMTEDLLRYERERLKAHVQDYLYLIGPLKLGLPKVELTISIME